MSMEDKMQQFIPGIAPGQVEFFHVAADGAVTRWWLVPGQAAPSIRAPAPDHPLGRNPAPGWYWGDGTPFDGDPRNKEQTA
jgi:hypothetical protein